MNVSDSIKSAIVVLLSVFMASCDDIKMYSTSMLMPGVIFYDEETGADVRLTVVSGEDVMMFDYYKDGMLRDFYYNNKQVLEDVDPFVLNYNYSNGRNGGRNTYKVRFDESGRVAHIRKMSSYWDDEYGEEGEKEVSVYFHYNNEDQLRSYSLSMTDNWVDNEGSHSYRGNTNMYISYSGGVMMSANRHSYGSTSNEYVISNYSEDCDYAFSVRRGEDNYYCQYTPNVTYTLGLADDVIEGLAYLGYFGRASEILPTVIIASSTEVRDGEAVHRESDYRCVYTFDRNEAIREADGCIFGYADISVGNRNVKSTSNTVRHRKRNMFDNPVKDERDMQ